MRFEVGVEGRQGTSRQMTAAGGVVVLSGISSETGVPDVIRSAERY